MKQQLLCPYSRLFSVIGEKMCSKHAVNNKPTRKIPFSKEHETEGEVQESPKELSTTKKLILSLVLL